MKLRCTTIGPYRALIVQKIASLAWVQAKTKNVDIKRNNVIVIGDIEINVFKKC